MAPSALDLPGLEEHFATTERELVAKLGETHATMASDFPEEHLKLYGELSDQLRKVRQHLQSVRSTIAHGTSENKKGTEEVDNLRGHTYGTPQSDIPRTEGEPSTLSTSKSAHERESTAASKGDEDIGHRTVASQRMRPRKVDAVSCVKCGRKKGFNPSAAVQLCQSCGPVREPSVGSTKSPTPSIAQSTPQHQRTMPSVMEEPTHGIIITSDSAKDKPEATGSARSNQQYSHSPETNKNSRDADALPKQFDQLDPENYPTVMWFKGAWREFRCFVCGANVRATTDGDRLAGSWWNGIKGLQTHVVGKHHPDPMEFGLAHSPKAMGYYQTANICLKRRSARRLGVEDIDRIKNGRHPITPIVKKVNLEKTFESSQQEQYGFADNGRDDSFNENEPRSRQHQSSYRHQASTEKSAVKSSYPSQLDEFTFGPSHNVLRKRPAESRQGRLLKRTETAPQTTQVMSIKSMTAEVQSVSEKRLLTHLKSTTQTKMTYQSVQASESIHRQNVSLVMDSVRRGSHDYSAA